ncbi:hypothetical protein, variant [Cryptococcus amylolentus CBS 6039]|uniref:Uncharacterized protein n=1 Tax=Cryptococcus amylolentus CBS 6039 TaxID=1295533 RepID=A0A1E3HRR0_9TREE|nr:hypothetical protein, variant [Cryptococcus amylolentus CBS 6039]ODN79039.1 hypothetical protein, variant [Cryptococcus amylolentus CBS 6039]
MSTTQLTHSALRTLVPHEDIPPLTLGQTTRASSFASSTTSTSSIYSRAADDLIDRFATHQPQTPIHLWSGGNVRLGNMDLTLTTHDAELLMHAMKGDERVSLYSSCKLLSQAIAADDVIVVRFCQVDFFG